LVINNKRERESNETTVILIYNIFYIPLAGVSGVRDSRNEETLIITKAQEEPL